MTEGLRRGGVLEEGWTYTAPSARGSGPEML